MFSALETFVIIALYKSTLITPYHTIPHGNHSIIPLRLWLRETWTNLDETPNISDKPQWNFTQKLGGDHAWVPPNGTSFVWYLTRANFNTDTQEFAQFYSNNRPARLRTAAAYYMTDMACIECVAGSTKPSCVHPSVCLSVPSSRHMLLLWVCCCESGGQEISMV